MLAVLITVGYHEPISGRPPAATGGCQQMAGVVFPQEVFGNGIPWLACGALEWSHLAEDLRGYWFQQLADFG